MVGEPVPLRPPGRMQSHAEPFTWDHRYCRRSPTRYGYGQRGTQTVRAFDRGVQDRIHETRQRFPIHTRRPVVAAQLLRHIVRDDLALRQIRAYIASNPARWKREPTEQDWPSRGAIRPSLKGVESPRDGQGKGLRHHQPQRRPPGGGRRRRRDRADLRRKPAQGGRRRGARIAVALPEGVLKVGVFVDGRPRRCFAIAREVGLDLAQLHGDESPETVTAVRGAGVEL